MISPLTNFLLSLGLTRDSFVWFWTRLVSAALLIGSGLVPLEPYVGERGAKIVQVLAVLILWLAGKYDSSPLPAGKK